MDAANETVFRISRQDLSHEIRPFPATATKIISLCSNSESQVGKISELIECEPAISIKLLSLANSPLFGTAREITTVSQAIVLLGYTAVSQMAISIASGPLFTAGNAELMEHRVKLFRESLGVATVCRLLADELGTTDASEAFLGGMMLDVGKLLFFDFVPEPDRRIIEQDPTGETTEREVATFGMDHPAVGEHCGRKWGLPNAINTAIREHHGEFRVVESQLSKLVLAGRIFARNWKLGFTDEESTRPIDELESEFFAQDFAHLKSQATDQFQAVESIFELHNQSPT